MAGGGGVVGLLSEWTPKWRSQFELRQRYYFLGEDNDLTELNAQAATPSATTPQYKSASDAATSSSNME